MWLEGVASDNPFEWILIKLKEEKVILSVSRLLECQRFWLKNALCSYFTYLQKVLPLSRLLEVVALQNGHALLTQLEVHSHILSFLPFPATMNSFI